MTKDEAIRRAAASTQPEVSLAVDGYMVVRTTVLAQHEYNYGELVQARQKLKALTGKAKKS